MYMTHNCSTKYAVAALKKKIYDKNPHVAKFGLIVSIRCSQKKPPGFSLFQDGFNITVSVGTNLY